jgi:coproporphyrinogen III oxidase-like Fe-S oxidoreductase
MEHGLYIHIPFCEQRCYYCAFTVAVSPENTFEPYINRLIREIELSGFNGDARTVYLGGGTPSLLNAVLLGRVLHTLRSVPGEVSIEVNPGNIRIWVFHASAWARSLWRTKIWRAPAACTTPQQSSPTFRCCGNTSSAISTWI